MQTTRKRVMRMAEVEQATGLNKRTIYRYVKEGLFPAPFKVGMRASGWWEHDVLGWLANRGNEAQVDHMEGSTWVTYKTKREPWDVKVGDSCAGVLVRRVEVRQ